MTTVSLGDSWHEVLDKKKNNNKKMKNVISLSSAEFAHSLENVKEMKKRNTKDR